MHVALTCADRARQTQATATATAPTNVDTHTGRTKRFRARRPRVRVISAKGIWPLRCQVLSKPSLPRLMPAAAAGRQEFDEAIGGLAGSWESRGQGTQEEETPT